MSSSKDYKKVRIHRLIILKKFIEKNPRSIKEIKEFVGNGNELTEAKRRQLFADLDDLKALEIVADDKGLYVAVKVNKNQELTSKDHKLALNHSKLLLEDIILSNDRDLIMLTGSDVLEHIAEQARLKAKDEMKSEIKDEDPLEAFSDDVIKRNPYLLQHAQSDPSGLWQQIEKLVEDCAKHKITLNDVLYPPENPSMAEEFSNADPKWLAAEKAKYDALAVNQIPPEEYKKIQSRTAALVGEFQLWIDRVRVGDIPLPGWCEVCPHKHLTIVDK